MSQSADPMNVAELRQRFLEQDVRVQRRPADTQDSPYVPIHLEGLMAGERLTFSLYLKVTAGALGEVQVSLYLAEGEVLEGSWLDKLKTLEVRQLYLHHQDLDKAIAYLNNHLLVKSGGEVQSPHEFCVMREHLNFTLRRAFTSPHLGQHAVLAKSSLNKLLNSLGRQGLTWKFIWDLLYKDYTLYNHSVNVAVLGMSMAVFLRKSRQECLIMGMAGLFHDLGLTRIKEDIIFKLEPLMSEEWELLKKHPCLGYQLLKGNAEIPVGALRLVLEHHELADGSGYPQGLALGRQHPLTRVLSLLEAYDGLTLYRPYRPRQTPYEALKTLQEQTGSRGKAFEPRTLKKFIEFLALT